MPRRAKVIQFPKSPPADEPESHDLVAVRRCRDQAEALVVRGLLDSESIRTVLRGQLVQSLHPFSVGEQGEVVVLVSEEDAPRALELLARAGSDATDA